MADRSKIKTKNYLGSKGQNRYMHNISAGKMAYAISLRFYYPYSRIIKILSVLTSLTNNSIDTSCSDHK